MTLNEILRAKGELDKRVAWALQDFTNATNVRVKELDTSALCDGADRLINYYVNSRLDTDGIEVEENEKIKYSNDGSGFGGRLIDG